MRVKALPPAIICFIGVLFLALGARADLSRELSGPIEQFTIWKEQTEASVSMMKKDTSISEHELKRAAFLYMITRSYVNPLLERISFEVRNSPDGIRSADFTASIERADQQVSELNGYISAILSSRPTKAAHPVIVAVSFIAAIVSMTVDIDSLIAADPAEATRTEITHILSTLSLNHFDSLPPSGSLEEILRRNNSTEAKSKQANASGNGPMQATDRSAERGATATTSTVTSAAAVEQSENELSRVSAGEIIGRDVYSQGMEIGAVADVVLDQDNAVFAVISVGGFLGVGSKDIAIPVEKLRLSEETVNLMSEMSEHELKQMPAYDEAQYLSLERSDRLGGNR